MKKSIKNIAAIFLAGLALASCTDEVQLGNAFLDKAPGGTANLDSIFTNPDYINQFLTGIYAQQYYGLCYNQNRQNSAQSYKGKLDGATDLYQVHFPQLAVWNDYYLGGLTAKGTPLISFSSDRIWETVHQACLIKENIDKCTTMDQRKKDYIVAQATALQAYAYTVLLPHYGGLPIVNKTITDTDDEIGPRKTFEETVNFIVDLCDEAKDHLYWAYNGNDSESNSLQTGRWTKAGVMALKAQVLWLAASPLFNDNQPYYDGSTEAEQNHLVWYGNYDAARWQRALQAFEDFWQENNNNGEYYHLLMPVVKGTDNLRDAYRVAYRRGYMMDDSPEVIHYTRVAETWGTQGTYSWLAWNGNGWYGNNGGNVWRLCHYPTVEYVEMFPWSDGSPFDRSTDMKYQETRDIEADGTTADVYTCLNGQYDKLFWKWTISTRSKKKEASRDPRLYENVLVAGTVKQLDFSSMEGKSTGTEIWENWVGGQDGNFDVKNQDGTISESLSTQCPTGFGVYKYVLSQKEFSRNYNMHWNVLTIPDMILMYAECLAETGNLTGAIEQVDKVRARVGMKSINSSYNKDLNLTSNKDNLIEEILRERACELGMTNARYIDMVRRKRTDWMTKQLHGMATYRMIKDPVTQKWVRRMAPWVGNDYNNGLDEPNRFEYEFFELFQGKRVLWDKDPNSLEVKKWLMSPFPQDEVNKGYGIVQNPGW